MSVLNNMLKHSPGLKKGYANGFREDKLEGIPPNRNIEHYSKCKTYRLQKGKSIRDMAHNIEDYLMYEIGMTSQVLRTQEGEYIVLGEDKNNNIKQWIGLSQTIIVRMTPSCEDTVCVRIEVENWIKKGAAMVTGIFFSKLLMLSSGYGMAKQALLPSMIDREIQRYLESPETN